MKGKIKSIEYSTFKDFILPKHYSGRIPSVSWAFGWYIDDVLVAVCSFGKPASNSLCKGICGDMFSSRVYELNRLCRIDNLSEQLSGFVSACLRILKPRNLIIVSYSDTAMSHNGYIYQASNFLYTGKTKQRTDKYTEGNKHSRHYDNDNQKGLRKVRHSKHRYVYFAMADRKLKRLAFQELNYSLEPYPKGINKNYILGDYLKPEIVVSKSKKNDR